MSASRKPLHTLQMSPMVNLGDKGNRLNTPNLSTNYASKQTPRITLSEGKENASARVNAKAKTSQNEVESRLISNMEKKTPKSDQIVGKPTEILDHEPLSDAVNSKTSSAPEQYWKKVAEQINISLDETLRENEELMDAVVPLYTKNNSLTEVLKTRENIVKTQDEMNSSQKDVLESQELEIEQLREKIFVGGKKLNNLLAAHDDFFSNESSPQQHPMVALSESEENAGSSLNAKANDQVDEVVNNSSLKVKTETIFPQTDQIAVISDHDSALVAADSALAGDSTAKFWKALAEERRVNLVEALREKKDLEQTIDTLKASIESLNADMEACDERLKAQDKIFELGLKLLESQVAEIGRLRELYAETERWIAILEKGTLEKSGETDKIHAEN